MRIVKPLHWAAVCFLFWAAVVVFRLQYASDIQDIGVWILTLPIAFGLPFMVGWNISRWTFYRRVHHLRVEAIDNGLSAADTTDSLRAIKPDKVHRGKRA